MEKSCLRELFQLKLIASSATEIHCLSIYQFNHPCIRLFTPTLTREKSFKLPPTRMINSSFANCWISRQKASFTSIFQLMWHKRTFPLGSGSIGIDTLHEFMLPEGAIVPNKFSSIIFTSWDKLYYKLTGLKNSIMCLSCCNIRLTFMKYAWNG